MKEFTRMFKMLDVFEFVAEFLFFMAIIGAVAYGCTGCASSPDGIYIDKTVWVYVTNRVDQAVEKHNSGSATEGSGRVTGASSGAVSESDSTSAAAGNSGGGETTAGSTPAAAVSLDFRYGGFKAKNPQEDSRCRIGKLKIGGDSLSFKWESGIPSDWKRGDTKKGPMILACAFYFDEKSRTWVGGKFDWIDEHRSSRPLENIKGGYNGWNTGAWNAAKRRGFCVVSADGKKRSNFIED